MFIVTMAEWVENLKYQNHVFFGFITQSFMWTTQTPNGKRKKLALTRILRCKDFVIWYEDL